MRYKERRQLEYIRVLNTITAFTPTLLWRFKFVRTWAERVAHNIATQFMDYTSFHVKEAWDAGWEAKEQHAAAKDFHTRNGLLPKESIGVDYIKYQGWVE